jgi:outer membrane receptor protein involved in Fe transport
VSYGTVFRSPSLNDLFWPDSLYSAGNPGLRPERGHAAEAGIECRTGGVTARFGGFTRDVRDQIDWAPDSAGKWQPRNVGLVRTRGLEGELSWRWRWIRAGGNLTAVDARQRQAEVLEYDPYTWAPLATGERERFAAHVPSWTAGASAGVDLPTRTGFSLAIRGAGPRRMYIEDTFETFPKTRTVTKRLGSFAVVNARVSQSLTDALEVYAGAENLADRRYASRFGNTVGDGDYPAPPRTWYAGATARW